MLRNRFVHVMALGLVLGFVVAALSQAANWSGLTKYAVLAAVLTVYAVAMDGYLRGPRDARRTAKQPRER